MKKNLFIFLAMLACHVTSAQVYKFYAGNLHAHTGYSDGNKDAAKTKVQTPKDSYAFAKKSEHFDFLGISEHNHSQAQMKLANYAKGLAEADGATSDSFVCLYGMEYGVIKGGGHVLIYGVDDLIGWEKGNFDVECVKSDYLSLWDILVDYPDAFATLAHPESSDYEDLLNTPYNKNADKVLCGVAILTGPAFAQNTDYKSKPSKKFINYFRGMLAAGYHVGPTVDHDNHYLTFGRMASSRTVVLAESLSRENVMEAYREMRFYATTDWNTKVNFTINGYPMGKRINTKKDSTIKVKITDDSDDTISSVKIMYGEPGSGELSTQLFKSTDGTFDHVHKTTKGSESYYYLEITQTDGDKIYTSPIWVHRLK